jgi:hypothetical protein
LTVDNGQLTIDNFGTGDDFLILVHLGQNIVVPEGEIVGVFDLDNTSSSRHTRAFLAKAETAGRVVSVPDVLPKSFVLTEAKGRARVYLSPLAASTIARRSQSLKFNI